MTAHKHAKLMMEYAKLAQEHERPWEYFETFNALNDSWHEISRPFIFEPCYDYRLKPPQPPTILINNIEVPEPLREGPEVWTRVYENYVDYRGMVRSFCWGDNVSPRSDNYLLSCGKLHLTADAARKHWNADCAGSKKG